MIVQRRFPLSDTWPVDCEGKSDRVDSLILIMLPAHPLSLSSFSSYFVNGHLTGENAGE